MIHHRSRLAWQPPKSKSVVQFPSAIEGLPETRKKSLLLKEKRVHNADSGKCEFQLFINPITESSSMVITGGIGLAKLRTRILGVTILLVVSCAVGAFPIAAVGQAKQESAPCSSETTTAGMRNCENLRYEKAQQELDSVYAQLMKQLDKTGKAKLKSAQSAWLRFRKAEADFQADSARGGTLAPLIRITVMADLTGARAAELKKSLQH